ncbi:ribosomal-processing cysteine protease Prp [Paenibacillus donghaensis]|uniref:ribosomal-processing cysteine protease Prp n=1 Tax=Paenibacillus donghaensis TaxID=414771 RepID=UPI0018831881|nr:ribosomal-processing cysteine protease Prp [Paenibacillus donghaensis]MBE9917962.1 ribosomal-processing cysteine protease Prp [Paenibacillus donghaensis]
MIKVRILRKQDGSIHGFEVKGHANYAKHGEDIVCAGVSTVTVGTVNSLETLTGTIMDSRMNDGFLSAYLPGDGMEAEGRQEQLLLESMVVMLNSIAESYGKYIQIQEVII